MHSIESPLEVESQCEGALPSPETGKKVTDNRSHTAEGGATPAETILIGCDPITMLRHTFNPSLHQPLKKLA